MNFALITTTGLSKSNSTLTEVRSIQGKPCNYVMEPYLLDVWGATGGKNSKDSYSKALRYTVSRSADLGDARFLIGSQNT